MREITLTGGGVALVDDQDFEALARYGWRLDQHSGYVVRTERGEDGKRRTVYMHRAIAQAPRELVVDHRNKIKTDNRRQNLRVCPQLLNRVGAQRWVNTARPYKGVEVRDDCKRPFCAIINSRGVRRILGRFDSAEDAARTYDRAARQEWGEFAHLNFPEEK